MLLYHTDAWQQCFFFLMNSLPCGLFLTLEMNFYSYVIPTVVFEQTVQARALLNPNYQLLFIHDKCNLVWYVPAAVDTGSKPKQCT